MADFNAGSIEGSLDLNTLPFKAGLAKAKQDAADFENKKIEPKLGMDGAVFYAKKSEVDADLEKLDHKKVDPKADLDIKDFVAKYAILNKLLNPGGLNGDGKGIFGLGLGGARITAMIGGLMGLVAAAGPASAALGALGLAGAAAFGGVAISLGLFGKAVGSAMTEITKANKAGVQLTGWAGTAQKALKGLTDEWHKLINSAHAGVMRDLALAFNMIAGILPKLAPLLRITAQGVGSILRHVNAVAHSKLFEQFLSTLEKFMHGFLAGAGPVISNLLKTFMGIFIQMQPLMAMLGRGIEKASSAVEHFATGQGLKTFLGYATKSIPPVLGLIGTLVHTLFNIGKGLAPLAGPALGFITALVHALGSVHLAPLAKGFGDLFTALKPLLPVLVTLINTLLKPIGQVLSGIAKGPIHQLTHGLQGELRPAFHALRGILHDLVKPLTAFAGSIANLANPTGVHLVTKLLVGLQGIVHKLAGPVGKLAVALENVVDDGINAMIPVLPFLAKGLSQAASALLPVIKGLGWVLSHKTVVDILLGIAGAVWLGVKAYQAYQAAVKAIEFTQGVIEAISFGWAGLTVAEDANTASTVANMLAQKLWRIQSIVTTAVTEGLSGAWAALTAVMDANPIMLVVIAVAALAAGLVYAYRHSKTFRDIVNGAFKAVADVAKTVFNWLTGAVVFVIDFIKNHWQLLLAILTGPIGLAAYWIISHWTQVRDFFGTAMSDIVNFVSNGVSAVISWFESLPGKILSFAGQMLDAGKNLLLAVFHGIESVDSTIMGWITGLIKKIIGAFVGIGGSILSTIKSSLGSAIHSAGGALGKALGKIGLASGGVTTGPIQALIGDNPGGREAVIPLDKYDIPQKGDVARIAGRSASDNAQIIGLLATIASHLAGQGSTKDLVDGLSKVLGDHQATTMRAMVQASRAA